MQTPTLHPTRRASVLLGIVALVAIAGAATRYTVIHSAHASAAPETRAGFVTTLGRDTVVLESFTRTDSKLEGQLVVRVPGTVLCRYSVDLGSDGAVKRATLDVDPMGTAEVPGRHVTMDYVGDSVRVTVNAGGRTTKSTRARGRDEIPQFMTGFGPSFGLYSSLGLYELLLTRTKIAVGDTLKVSATGLADGALGQRMFFRRSTTMVDADYFGVVWTHLDVDAEGHVRSADATGTTEKTESHRTDAIDVERAAKAFAAADRSGKGIGTASPNVIDRGSIGRDAVITSYGSPRKRGRVILGTLVPFDHVWRTGANEATTIAFDKPLEIGGTLVPAGTYSLFTLPAADGSVKLIVNQDKGQWGTEYHSARDLARIPMQVSKASAPQEAFTIAVKGDKGVGELRMTWDEFVWSVPVIVK